MYVKLFLESWRISEELNRPSFLRFPPWEPSSWLPQISQSTCFFWLSKPSFLGFYALWYPAYASCLFAYVHGLPYEFQSFFWDYFKPWVANSFNQQWTRALVSSQVSPDAYFLYPLIYLFCCCWLEKAWEKAHCLQWHFVFTSVPIVWELARLSYGLSAKVSLDIFTFSISPKVEWFAEYFIARGPFLHIMIPSP